MHEFGGKWTQEKIKCLKKYLPAYTTALKKQRFRKIYIDAFAGTGERINASREHLDSNQYDFSMLLEAPQTFVISEKQAEFFDGSAKIALDCQPPFDEFHFIEKDKKKAARLKQLVDEAGVADATIHTDDANSILPNLLRNLFRGPGGNLRSARGVLFLDPYGCQVDWETIKAVRASEAIDMFYLFPSGLGVYRMLAKNPARVSDSWARRLDRLLGTDKWRDFYVQTDQMNLFAESGPQARMEASIDDIELFFLERLRGLFPHVASKVLPIYSPTGYHMFSLYFAAANEAGGHVGVGIANHILERAISRER